METLSRAILMPVKVVCSAVVLLLFFNCSGFAGEITDRVDGTVVNVDEKNRLLRVDFEHPATFEHSEMQFYVAEDAGFHDFKKLKDLQKGDGVSVDYLDYGKTLKAIYIIRIPQEKTYFTRKEIAEALVKIKSNQKHEEDSKKN